MPVTRPAAPDGVTAELPLRQSNAGGSGSFLVRADDRRRYWCKALNNGQDPRVPANEQIVGRVGALVEVAVCEVALVRIPAELVGWQFRPGQYLEEGWAHGSLAVDPALETHALEHRADDDNARRHVGFYALHDWLGGSDLQWLIATDEENAYYSHDHGYYVIGRSDWSVADLRAQVNAAFPLGPPTTGLDLSEFELFAARIESVSEEDVAGALSNIPNDWPVSDEDLDAALDFLLERRGAVAERLRAMI